MEIRHLQRTEVREVEEPFTAGQKGSSAMPHKRNPILSENLTGLARLLRGYALRALEDVPLWHERDISHSCVERVIGPDATVTLDFMLHRFAGLVEQTCASTRSRCARTSTLLGGVVNSPAHPARARAQGHGPPGGLRHRPAQRDADVRGGRRLPHRAVSGRELAKWMTPEEIAACFSLDDHLRHVDDIFARVFGAAARATGLSCYVR